MFYRRDVKNVLHSCMQCARDLRRKQSLSHVILSGVFRWNFSGGAQTLAIKDICESHTGILENHYWCSCFCRRRRRQCSWLQHSLTLESRRHACYRGRLYKLRTFAIQKILHERLESSLETLVNIFPYIIYAWCSFRHGTFHWFGPLDLTIVELNKSLITVYFQVNWSMQPNIELFHILFAINCTQAILGSIIIIMINFVQAFFDVVIVVLAGPFSL